MEGRIFRLSKEQLGNLIMRRSLTFLATVLVLFSFVSPSRAESTCGSDTSSDPVKAMGKDVWLNGYCKGFLPCRQVLAAFENCQAAEGFLSRLEAKEGQPLTEDHVADALGRTTGTSTNMSACLWNFDAQGCKQYLGVGAGIGASASQTESSVLPAVSSVEAKKRAMSQNAALVARQRVRDMDANAHTGIGVIERACRAGSDECKKTLDSMVTPVVRAADEMNANAEYLAHFPPHSPSATEYASRLGWTQHNGQWVFNNLQKTGGNGTTLGAYLLMVDECRKLYDRLDREIKARPNEEPVELSFLEAECLPQLPEHQAAIARWRQGFKGASTRLASTSASGQLPDRKTTEDLNRWDGGIRQAEAARKKAMEENELRAAQQRMRDEEEAAKQVNTNANQTNAPGWDATGGAQTICRSERANYVQAFRVYGKQEGIADAPYFRGKAALASINLGNMSGTDEAGRQIALKRERIAEANNQLQKGGKQSNPNFHKLAIAQANYDICLIETIKNYQGSLDLNALTGGTGTSDDLGPNLSRGATGSSKPGAGGTGKDNATCELALKKAEAEVNSTPPPQQGAMAAMQYAMWAAKKGLTALDDSCPNSGKYVAMRQEWQQAYDSAAAGCSQLKSGGGACSPERN